jgi:glycosyltransferase involved in cell wall biosynthesis
LELHVTVIPSPAHGDVPVEPPATTPLRIALVAPPFYSIPPTGYGGIEAVVAQLADGLVDRGHEVTLIAARGSRTKAQLLTTFDEPQWERLGRAEPELLHAARVSEHLADLSPDLVHDHSAAGPAFVRDRSVPTVVTSHGPATGDWGEYLEAGGEGMYLVAISQAQVDLTPQLPWRAVVHNSLDTRDIPFRAEKEDYLVWLGRMSPDKAAHLAIDVARKAGRRIVLVGKCSEPDEQAYFDAEVQPRLGPDVEYHGEIELDHKYDLLGGAAAFLFPLQWEEPFGMVLIEAMACGTPVLSLNRGAVPEVVVDGVTGFVRREPDELVEALRELDQIDPRACRQHVEDNFGPDRMVSGYEQVYRDCRRDAAATAQLAVGEP